MNSEIVHRILKIIYEAIILNPKPFIWEYLVGGDQIILYNIRIVVNAFDSRTQIMYKHTTVSPCHGGGVS